MFLSGIRPKSSLILHTIVYFTNELTHSCTCDLSTSSFLTPSEGCPRKMICNESFQCQPCTERALSLPGEPRTCPGLSPISSHRPRFLICSSSMGRLKMYIQTQTEGTHVGKKPQRHRKNERETFTHHEWILMHEYSWDTPCNAQFSPSSLSATSRRSSVWTKVHL